MSRKVVIDRKVLKYLSELPEKSRHLIKQKCHALAEDPYPGKGGDKELLHLEFKLYRLHVGRSFTVFYQIGEDEDLVKILDIATIDKAHKLYRHFQG
ncbi:MAG TPA: type II toxin-antitoxin system RelE/ParE family toxin [Methanothrix sp.]